jgi:hypothetical protein
LVSAALPSSPSAAATGTGGSSADGLVEPDDSAAIPLAIPLPDETAPLPVGPNTNSSLSADQDRIRIVERPRPARRRRAVVFWISLMSGIGLLAALAMVMRPDLRDRLGISRNDPLAVKEPTNLPAARTPETRVKPDAPIVPRAVAPAHRPTSPDPAPPASQSEVVSSSGPPRINPVIPATQPINDAAVDFLARSIVHCWRSRDFESASELYSYLEESAVAPDRRDLVGRLGILGDAYQSFGRRLSESGVKILAGTSLEIGPEKIPVALVEASPLHVVLRDSGRNRRFPHELVPQSVAWSIVDASMPNHPETPVLKALVRGLMQFEDDAVCDGLVASLDALATNDSKAETIRQALTEFLRVDRLGVRGPIVANRNADFERRWSEAIAALPIPRRSAADAEVVAELLGVLADTDSLSTAIRLEAVKRQWLDRDSVAWAACAQIELGRHLSPERARSEAVELFVRLSRQASDPRRARQLCTWLARFAADRAADLSSDQIRRLEESIEAAAAHCNGEAFVDAVRQWISKDAGEQRILSAH